MFFKEGKARQIIKFIPEERNTNFNSLMPISFQPNVVDLRCFKL